MNINTKNIFGPKDVKKAMKVWEDAVPEMLGKQRVLVGDSYNELLEAILDYYNANQDPDCSAQHLCDIQQESEYPYKTTRNIEAYFKPCPNKED